MKRKMAKLGMGSWKEQMRVGTRKGERRGINNTKDTCKNLYLLKILT